MTSEDELAQALSKLKGITLDQAMTQVRAFSETAISKKINKIAANWSNAYPSDSRVQISDVVESLRATARMISA